MLLGLWWSGLRITEAYHLRWTDDRMVAVDLRGKRPMFVIKAEANKNRKDQRFPLAPKFAEMLCSIADADREGLVFKPTLRGRPASRNVVGRIVSAIGRAAGIIVDRTSSGKPVYANAHDLRRSFGTR